MATILHVCVRRRNKKAVANPLEQLDCAELIIWCEADSAALQGLAALDFGPLLCRACLTKASLQSPLGRLRQVLVKILPETVLEGGQVPATSYAYHSQPFRRCDRVSAVLSKKGGSEIAETAPSKGPAGRGQPKQRCFGSLLWLKT